MPYLTDDEMLRHEQVHAAVCLGGLVEGFDYSESRAILHYWAVIRRAYHHQGGIVFSVHPTAVEAKTLTALIEGLPPRPAQAAKSIRVQIDTRAPQYVTIDMTSDDLGCQIIVTAMANQDEETMKDVTEWICRADPDTLGKYPIDFLAGMWWAEFNREG